MEMNGYKLHADGYRQYLEKHPDIPSENKEYIEREIKVLETMVVLDEKECMMLFDTGAFNRTVISYAEEAMKLHHMNDDDIDAVLRNISYLFDTKPASQMCE